MRASLAHSAKRAESSLAARSCRCSSTLVDNFDSKHAICQTYFHSMRAPVSSLFATRVAIALAVARSCRRASTSSIQAPMHSATLR